MNEKKAADAFSCLSSSLRLKILRLLIKHESGLVAGEISASLDIPPTNLSFHLKSLTQAELLTVEQEGRFQRYAVNLLFMQNLINFLTEECCNGNVKQCFYTNEPKP